MTLTNLRRMEWIFLGAMVAALVTSLVLGWWLLAFNLGLLTFITLTNHYARRWTYRTGWLQGRADLLASMAEAHQRGLTPDEWARSQMEVDRAMMNDWLNERRRPNRG